MAHSTAIGCGCLLGAGAMSHLHAAEWSVQPIFSIQTDYDSNRNYSLQPEASEEAVLYGDLKVQWAIENTQIFLEPRFDLRRYSSSIWGPGNDRSLNAGIAWTGEHMKVSLTGSIADQTTLITELTETGITNTDSRRKSDQANGEWDWWQSERYQTYLQVGYIRASYSGTPLISLELPGYRYPNGAFGERFFLKERMTFSVSAFGDALSSDRVGNSSHEAGGQVEFQDQVSEKNSFDISIGESKRYLYGERNTGTNAAVNVTHMFERGSIALNYVRSLVPYGTGFLVQRQQVGATLIRPLAPTLDLTLSLQRVQNNAATVRLGLDRPFYNVGALGLNWRMGESWSLQPQVSSAWTRPVTPLNSNDPAAYDVTLREWRAQLTLVWQPLPASKTR
jgi:hypothetical protein